MTASVIYAEAPRTNSLLPASVALLSLFNRRRPPLPIAFHSALMTLRTDYDAWHQRLYAEAPDHEDASSPWYRLVPEYLGPVAGLRVLESRRSGVQ
jgi:hypothetical protein